MSLCRVYHAFNLSSQAYKSNGIICSFFIRRYTASLPQWPSMEFWKNSFAHDSKIESILRIDSFGTSSELLKDVLRNQNAELSESPKIITCVLRNVLFKHLLISETQMPYKVWLYQDLFKVMKQLTNFEESAFKMFLPLYKDIDFQQVLSLIPSVLPSASPNEILEMFTILQFFPALHKSSVFQQVFLSALHNYAKADYSAIYVCEQMMSLRHRMHFSRQLFSRLKEDLKNAAFDKNIQSLYAIGIVTLKWSFASRELHRQVLKKAIEIGGRHIAEDDIELMGHFLPVMWILGVSSSIVANQQERAAYEDFAIRMLSRALKSSTHISSTQLEKFHDIDKTVSCRHELRLN